MFKVFSKLYFFFLENCPYIKNPTSIGLYICRISWIDSLVLFVYEIFDNEFS